MTEASYRTDITTFFVPIEEKKVSRKIRINYSTFGMIQPGRSYTLSGDSAYHFAFNGKYHDDNIYGKDNSYDYGKRFYDPRLGRFFSMDPIFKEYPELSTYQFGSNSPISGIDIEGSEYYYSADGTLLGKVGTSTEVMLVNAESVKQAQQTLSSKTPDASILNKASTDLGMTNQQLNTKAMLSTIRKSEGHGTETPYDQKYGVKNHMKGDISKQKHPPVHHGHSPAGAYQITLSTWNHETKALKLNGYMSQENQDKIATAIVTKYAGPQLSSGDIDGAIKNLNGQWSSLPGGKDEYYGNDEAKAVFKQYVSQILTSKAKEINAKKTPTTPAK